ncbi:MAG: 50S ribosomal protein L20 [Planctomycetes bacterium]|jgi:large subunit ribosomal protein L20|nr:50S ribosomal protein L20 [Planctomycetota bacterium]
MPRTKKGHAVRKAKKRELKRVRGHRAMAGHTWRLATEALRRAEIYARRDRRQRKRDFRGLWILRLNAACKQRGMRYSEFIHGLKKANITLNRKMLSEIAIADPQGFDAITQEVKAALA